MINDIFPKLILQDSYQNEEHLAETQNKVYVKSGSFRKAIQVQFCCCQGEVRVIT